MDTRTQEHIRTLTRENSDLKKEMQILREEVAESGMRNAVLHARFAALETLLGAAARHERFEEKIKYILQKTKEFTGADRVTLYVKRGKSLESHFKDGEEVKSIVLPLGRGMAGHVLQTQEAYLLGSRDQWPGPDPEWVAKTGYQVKSAMTVPLIGANGVGGVLQVLNRLDGKPFDAESLKLFQLFAALLELVFPVSQMAR